jgi:hypothetical protein
MYCLRSGFRVLTGLPGWPSQFLFKKIQNNVILVKKKHKNQQVVTGFLSGFARSTCRVGRVTQGHDFFYFFSTRPDSSSELAGSQVDPLDRTGFQNYIYIYIEGHVGDA